MWLQEDLGSKTSTKVFQGATRATMSIYKYQPSFTMQTQGSSQGIESLQNKMVQVAGM